MGLIAIVEVRTRSREASGELATDAVVELRRPEGDTIALVDPTAARRGHVLEVRSVTTERVILVARGGDGPRCELAIGEREQIASPDDLYDFASWELRLVAVASNVDARSMPGGSELERELLAAIRANPDDDVPRLVYADWLLSQPAPDDRTRGELVQIQCAVATDRLRELRERERELVAALPVPQLPELTLSYTRGFVERCEGTLAGFAKEAVAVFQVAPQVAVLDLEVGTVPNQSQLQRLGEVPELGRVRELALRPRPSTMMFRTDEVLAALAPRLASLRRLRARELRIGQASVQAVLAGPACPQLAMLDLSGNPLAGAPVRALAESSRLAPAVLRLAGCELRAADAAAIAAAGWVVELEELDLCDNPIGAQGATTLGGVAFRRLRRLALASCEIARAEALLRSRYLSRLVYLRLHRNPIGDRALHALVRGRARAIEELDLQSCELGDDGLAALAESTHVRAARRWRLGGNRIGDAGARAIARSPHLDGLVELDLASCRIGDDGAAALAAWAPSDTTLALAGNPIGDAGAIALVASAARSVVVSGSGLSRATVERVRDRFGSPAIVG